ncbi:MAG: DsbA family protein [Desulfobulbia bacterium]
MNSPCLREIVTGDLKDAGRLGVTGTPKIFINGRKLKQRSLEGLQPMIDDELRKLN